MRRRDLLAGALAFAAAPAAARPLMPLHESPREILSPPFVDGDGRDLTLADFRGRVVLLNVWATWCAPCREEMPTLDRLQAQLGGDDFHVLPLSIDRAGLGPVQRALEPLVWSQRCCHVLVDDQWSHCGSDTKSQNTPTSL